MLRIPCVRLAAGAVSSALSSSSRGTSPLEMFELVQQGAVPPLAAQRNFLAEHFRSELEAKGIHDSKLHAMDYRTCTRLLRKSVLSRYLSLPLRVFTFDMEFTEAPRFTAEGPTADIIEIGVYSPARNERLSVLVKIATEGRIMPKSTIDLTGITPEELEKKGVSFEEAWRKVEAFLAIPEPDELPGSEERILLLSHGGKLADVSMLQWALKRLGREVPKRLVFGDTFNIIRDAHRRRPVTPDKHPPSWRLVDLVQWLKVDTGNEHAHRAGDDAKLTWDAVFHTLDRYGDATTTARQQLTLRYFADAVKHELVRLGDGGGPASRRGSRDATAGGEKASSSSVVDFDLDAIFRETRSMPPSAERRILSRSDGSIITDGNDSLATEGERRMPVAEPQERSRDLRLGFADALPSNAKKRKPSTTKQQKQLQQKSHERRNPSTEPLGNQTEALASRTRVRHAPTADRRKPFTAAISAAQAAASQAASLRARSPPPPFVVPAISSDIPDI